MDRLSQEVQHWALLRDAAGVKCLKLKARAEIRNIQLKERVSYILQLFDNHEGEQLVEGGKSVRAHGKLELNEDGSLAGTRRARCH